MMIDDEYNLIIMASPYQKILKRNQEKEGGQREGRRRVNSNKAHLHMISFDDSEDSSRVEIPNIFLDDRERDIDPYSIPPSPPKPKKKPKPPAPAPEPAPVLYKTDSEQQVSSPTKSPSKRLVLQAYNQPQPDVEEQIAEPQPQPQIHAHSSLSMIQILKLNLGEFMFWNRFPMKKSIYINNNNEEENQINQKEIQLKNKERSMLFFNNSLQTSSFLFVLALLMRNIFGYLYFYGWVGIIVLQFVQEYILIKLPDQYGHDKASLIVLLALSVILQTVADWLTFRKRRLWQQNDELYKIYHHNGTMAEWVNTKGSQIKAGNIFKLQPGQHFPTDCLLVHSQRSLVHINQTAVISQLVEHPSEITLKESLIHAERPPLPLSGCFVYEINNPEYTDFQIVGKLNLEEPNKHVHAASMSNIVLRGCVYVGKTQIVCMSLQTGIDSLLLKSLQHPYTQRHQHEVSQAPRRKQISDKLSEEIQRYENTFMGLNIEKKIEYLVSIMVVIYFSMVLLGILVKFCFGLTTHNEYYMPQTGITLWKVVIYHATNYIIFIPVTMYSIWKLYVAISGSLTQYNISKRELDINADVDRHKRANSLMESTSSKMEELLDHKKIIFPLKIKDHNLIPELAKIDTIVTTIDTFRDSSAFTLHSIQFKEIKHNFITNSLDNQAYSVSDIQQMKYFMSVALLTSTKNENLPGIDEPNSYDTCIEASAKRYFDLQKNKNAKDEIRIGTEFAVRQLFHIDPLYEYPYKVIFLEPIVSQAELEQEAQQYNIDDSEMQNRQRTRVTQKKRQVLVLIRGNPKIILDKCYGRAVHFTEESRRLQEQKGFHVELLAKLSLHGLDAIEIQKAYESHTMEKHLFYKNLDKYISKVESMGLLVFVNQFHQKKIGESLKNPILNKSIINFNQHRQIPNTDSLSSKLMPNMIILTPWSKSQQPQFESIHTITNLLISPYLFHLNLSQVGDKIYHERPHDLDKMINKLDDEKVVVWNNWEQKDITYTLEVMKQYGRNILFYTQKDEYMFVMKQVDCSVKGGTNGYDAQKYSDITLSSKCSMSYLYLLQLIKYDSILVRQGGISLIFTHLGKFIFYIVMEIVNLFYTRGTGLMIIKTPLFIVIEVVLMVDVMYYLNWADSARAYTFSSKRTYLREVGLKVLQKSLQALFVTFITIYATQTPAGTGGFPHGYHFTYFTMAFSILHILVVQKLFNLSMQAFSFYKGVVMGGQVLLIYLGFILVSVVDKYHYKGILWGALKSGNIWMTVIANVWVCLTIPAIRWLWNVLKYKALRSNDSKKLL